MLYFLNILLYVSTGTHLKNLGTFHPRCCFNSIVSCGLVRVGLYFSLNKTYTNKYAHVAVVRGHGCRTLCSVGAYGARVAHHLPSNS